MKFSTMNPADRMKASGLIGLIVVALFVFIHTMVGAISKKPPSSAAVQEAVGSTTGLPSAAAPSGNPALGGPAPSTPEKDFALPKHVAEKPSALRTKLNMDVPDPFVQIDHPKDHVAPPPPQMAWNAAPRREPPPDVQPFRLPPLGAQRAPAAVLPGFGQAPAAAAAPKNEPEIKLVGIVDGEPGVATFTIAGKTTLARPGDALADGYRLVDIDAEGVSIHHAGSWLRMRVGAGINDTGAAAKQ